MPFKLIDLSHTIENGMITYKGLPGPVITDHLSREQSRALYESGTQFHIGKIEMVANTGTYLDSPFHRYADGKDLADLDLRSIANLEGVVVHHVGAAESELERAMVKGLTTRSGSPSFALRAHCGRDARGPSEELENTKDKPGLNERRITAAELASHDLRGKAVLFHTGWDMRWRTEEYSNGQHPLLTADTADYLAKEGASLVGIDSYNIDDTADGRRPAHSILLAHGIPIVEHLCGLRELPDAGFSFFAVPVKVRRFGTFPVRAFAIVGD